MKIFVADTYELMSKQAVDDIVHIMQSRKNPVICTASGDTPAGLYKEIVKRVNANELNTGHWRFVGLDEWVGMNGNDEGSCRYHLNRELFGPLNVTEDQLSFFDGRAADLDAECERVESFIKKEGGIDVAILGVGMNGHVGMNEPGTSEHTRSHVIELHPTTQQVGQKYFKTEQKLTKGVTLGIESLMDVRHIVLIISGKHKAAVTQQIIEDEISEQLPASLLRRHPALKIYLDADAASKIVSR